MPTRMTLHALCAGLALVAAIGCQRSFQPQHTGEYAVTESRDEILLDPMTPHEPDFNVQLMSVASDGSVNLRVPEAGLVNVHVGDAVPGFENPVLIVWFSDPHTQAVLLRVRQRHILAVPEDPLDRSPAARGQ